MAHIHVPAEVSVCYLPRSRKANLLILAFIVVGVVSFYIRWRQDPQAAWISYITNWLYFTSVSMGGLLLAIATWITKAKWNWSMRRVNQSFVAFLPLSFLLVLPMLSLGESYFPWIEMMAGDPVVQNKSAYLNMPFLIARNILGLAALFGVALYFVYLALRPDMGLTDQRTEAGGKSEEAWRARLTRGWMGQEKEQVRSYKRMTTIAPVFVIMYAVVMTMLSYDWIMSLEPHWFSTMLGPWFFMGAFWAGIAATALWSMYLRTQHEDFHRHIGLQQRHDIGKLAFGFCVFWTYLFFSQYIVIWYGKLPWEQAWIVRRSDEVWGGLSGLVILLCFVIPFAGLIGRKPKTKPVLLAFFTSVILVGMWLERYVMLAPSLHHEGDPVFTIWQPLIGLMFLGLYLGSVRWFLTTFPAIQVWQPMVDPETREAEIPAGFATD
ncbi:MAG TPA: hypothetical protein EYO20_09320 [Gemmatimonadetes bacterium]|nr:hypothetical protein [Gemmatimonadota bacterium]HIB10016.1 hypothetical protein [Gemmatimonadota bacterium]HIN79165.1 hypothetical protein [Gemmatimonadota bacterium]